MTDYDSDRRLFAAMRAAGWTHDAETGGFAKKTASGNLWVSWGQAEDALRFADEGETVVGVAPQSREVAVIINAASNDE